MPYKVKRQFTDSKGKAWKPGEPFQGNDDEIHQQLDAGNIEAAQPAPPPGTGKGGGGSERGGAPV
jgi:hypothetical protein